MQIIIDTREQTPYDFSGYQVEIIPGTLTSGDYSLPGFTDLVAVERKELTDLLACLSYDRARFTRELERLRGYHAAALVVEAPYSTIASGRYRSKIDPDAATQSLVSIMANYRLPVFFAHSRADAEFFTFNFLRHFLRHAEQRYKAIEKQAKSEEKPATVETAKNGGRKLKRRTV